MAQHEVLRAAVASVLFAEVDPALLLTSHQKNIKSPVALPFEHLNHSPPSCCLYIVHRHILLHSAFPQTLKMHSAFMFQVLALWCSSSLIAASPLTTPNIGSHLYPRTNPCQPGGTPILYQFYYANLCPPSITMNADGSCPVSEDFASFSCVGYCEVRQYFFYDQEQPVIDNPYCHGPLTCTVSMSQAFTYTYQSGGSISLKILDALTLGITGGLNYASAKTQLQSTSINLPAGQCGYFTFLPELHTSWYNGPLEKRCSFAYSTCSGSLTVLTSPSTGGGNGATCLGGTTTTGNYWYVLISPVPLRVSSVRTPRPILRHALVEE